LERHSNILSSKTVLRFSTQKESTGPSKQAQYLVSFETLMVNCRNNLLAMPSFQLCVMGS